MEANMKRVYLLLLTWAVCAQFVFANTDGFNIYKDLLRGKNDETDDMASELTGQKVLYFYRTALNPLLNSKRMSGAIFAGDVQPPRGYEFRVSPRSMDSILHQA